MGKTGGVTTERTSITAKGGLCYSSYLILGLEWWAGCRKSKEKNRVNSKEFWGHSSMMWLIVSCVAQSKARVHTGESGGSYWTCLILPSSPPLQLLITFTLMMFQCQLITPPDVSLSLRFLFPCWLGSADMSSFLSSLVVLWIHPNITACLSSACEMTTHSWSTDTLCSPCKSMLELQLFRGEIKDFITGVMDHVISLQNFEQGHTECWVIMWGESLHGIVPSALSGLFYYSVTVAAGR